MVEVTHILWKAAGRPGGDGCQNGVCRVCGQTGVGLSFTDWVRDTFTDLDKVVPGEIICHACQFAFSEASDLLALRVGKDRPQRMRNYSHFVVRGEWIPLSKSDKRRMTDILRGDFDVAVIANSGQKHIIFRAVPGVVQFEEHRIRDVDTVLALLDPIQALYTGFSKDEIETGRYKQWCIAEFGIERWYDLERKIAPFRDTGAFELALFLAQKGATSNDEDA